MARKIALALPTLPSDPAEFAGYVENLHQCLQRLVNQVNAALPAAEPDWLINADGDFLFSGALEKLSR